MPREGVIACGYLVSTVLQHAGFRVQRYKLAQQASEYIVRTLTPTAGVHWLRHPEPADVEAALPRDGLYVVAPTVSRERKPTWWSRRVASVEFCHSSYVGNVTVTCEPFDRSPGFASSAYVVGELLTDDTLRMWLDGAEFATARPPRQRSN